MRITALVLLLSLAASARAAGPGLAFEVQARDYDSRETTPGGFTLNREQGRLDGIAMELASTGRVGHWTLRVAQEQGELSYDGFSQLGIPILTTTELRARSLVLGWQPAQLHAGATTITGGFEFAHQRIDREIQPGPLSQALTEILDATWVRGTVGAGWPFHANWSLQARAALAWSVARRLEVNTFGTYDRFTLTPRPRLSYRIGVGVEWRASAQLRAGLWAGREEWRFGRSAVRDVRRDAVVVGSAEYPGSRQILDGLTLRMEAWF